MNNIMNVDLRYEKRQKYQLPQSSIRYQYRHPRYDVNGKRINQQMREHLTWGRNNIDFVHSVSSATLIVTLKIFTDIIKFWGKKSREINGWDNSYLLQHNAKFMMNKLKQKYKKKCCIIEFDNVHSIYEILGYTTTAPWKQQEVYFNLWRIAANNQDEKHYIRLLYLIEALAKSQLIWLIPNYKSRGDRKYELPWKVTEDAAIKYKKRYSITKIKKLIHTFGGIAVENQTGKKKYKNVSIKSFFHVERDDTKNISQLEGSKQDIVPTINRKGNRVEKSKTRTFPSIHIMGKDTMEEKKQTKDALIVSMKTNASILKGFKTQSKQMIQPSVHLKKKQIDKTLFHKRKQYLSNIRRGGCF